MADEIRRMQDYTASDINDNIAEVRTARGTFDTLDDRLDNIEGGGFTPTQAQLDAMNSTATQEKIDQIETNKNNISSIEKANGTKNYVYNFGEISNGGCKFVYNNADGSVTVTGTKSSQLSIADIISNHNLSDYDLSAGEQIVIVSNNANIGIVVIFSDGTTQDSAISAYNETKTVTIPSGRTKWYVRLQVKPATTGTINETAKLMVCKKSLYDIDPSFVPWAMSNAELTNNILTYAIPTCTDTAFTTSTTGAYVYTGISFTVPSGEVWEFFVADKYNGSGTTNFSNGLLVSDSSSAITNVSVIAENTQVPSVSGISYWVRQLTGLTPKRTNATTYYVWTNRAVTTSCNIFMCLRRVF